MCYISEKEAHNEERLLLTNSHEMLFIILLTFLKKSQIKFFSCLPWINFNMVSAASGSHFNFLI